jgi:tetratricopeptide (TPR) repeat protein
MTVIAKTVNAQPPQTAGDLNHFLTAGDNLNWAHGDSVQKLFYNLNTDRIQTLSDAFANLRIDRCHHFHIQIVLKLDDEGLIRNLVIQQGSTFAKTDSSIRSILLKQPGNWRMPFQVHKDSLFETTLNFYLLNDYTKHDHERIATSYYIATTDIRSTNPAKSCKDADFYYSSGLKNFKDANYKHAISDFENVVKLNPNDVDALYNLSISNYKMGDKAKACSWMKQAAELDVTIDEATINQVCAN